MAKYFRLKRDMMTWKAGEVYSSIEIPPAILWSHPPHGGLQLQPYWQELPTLEIKGGKVVILDQEDYEKLKGYKWYIINSGYVYRSQHNPEKKKTEQFSMSREIMGVLDEDWRKVQVDHINGNKLDNRKENLRIVNPQKNMWNTEKRTDREYTSQYKGVYWSDSANKWVANISVDGKTTYLGGYEKEVDAAYAYDEKARELYGEHALTNFTKEQYWRYLEDKDMSNWIENSTGVTYKEPQKGDMRKNKDFEMEYYDGVEWKNIEKEPEEDIDMEEIEKDLDWYDGTIRVAKATEEGKQVAAFLILKELTRRLNDGWEPDWYKDTTVIIRVNHNTGLIKVKSGSEYDGDLFYFKDEATAEKALQLGESWWKIFYNIA